MGRRNDAQPYFAAANNLRSSIMRNREDARFAAQDGEIIYIFDTNVFIFHSDLNDGNKISRDFYTLIGRGGSDPLARTIERLTADFLFSCRLPGQRRAGFISVPHLEEVLLQTQRIAKKLKSGGRGVEVDLKEIQRHEIRSILQSNITTETKLKRLGQVLPAAWMSNLNAKAHFTRAVRSAFLEPERTLVPLDREAWGREAAQFTMAEVNEWSKVLPSSNQREPKAIEDDALTLQLIVNLIKKSSLDRRVKFVFVTADDKLERAVNARASELGIENFVRSPRDYLPLINFKSMFNALGRDEIDSDLGKQFEVLFDKFNDALDWITIPQEHALDSDRTWSDNMKSIREAWIAASESATVINAHHISDGGDDIFAHVAEFVEDTGEGAVAALVDKSVEELRRRHVAIVLDSAISDLSLVRRGQNNRIARRVGLQLIGVTLGNLIGDVTLNDFLDSLIVPGKLPEATSRAINERPESYEAQLLACAIFVAAERWSAGIDFGWRAWREAKGKKGHRRSEAAYLVALCLRFSMQDPYHLRRAVELKATIVSTVSANIPVVPGPLWLYQNLPSVHRLKRRLLRLLLTVG